MWLVLVSRLLISFEKVKQLNEGKTTNQWSFHAVGIKTQLSFFLWTNNNKNNDF